MRHFKNFKTCVYCTAQTLASLDETTLARDYAYLEKYVGIDKVYLETYRDGTWVAIDHMKMIQNFFKEHGVEIAGGITTVTPPLEKDDAKRQRLFQTFCYSNEAMRTYLKKIVTYTAELFDEIILDDFFFTSCTCDDCLRERSNLSWAEFRSKKMIDVAENLVLKPAKLANPSVKVNIKYPNWRESYHETGYVPKIQPSMFDKIYTGTETRNTAHTDQHLPRYLSYSIMRYMEHVAPGRNGGGWFDTYSCWPIDCYLEQGYLTALSRPQEITLFQWGDLFENRLVTPLGMQLGKLDRILNQVGTPCGTPVYLPYASDGENHIEDHLGMHGIPFEPVPDFPTDSENVFLTQAALKDPDILQKLEAFLRKGGTAVVTTGFASHIQAAQWAQFSSVRFTGRKLTANRYHVTDDFAGFYENQQPVTFDELQFSNNASWSYVNAGSGDSHSSILLLDTYGKGKLFTLAAPDCFADFAKLPIPVMDMIRRPFASHGLYISGKNVSLFQYNNDTFVLYCYAGSNALPERVSIHLLSPACHLTDLNGKPIGNFIETFCHHQQWDEKEWITSVLVHPGEFYAFKIAR